MLSTAFSLSWSSSEHLLHLAKSVAGPVYSEEPCGCCQQANLILSARWTPSPQPYTMCKRPNIDVQFATGSIPALPLTGDAPNLGSCFRCQKETPSTSIHNIRQYVAILDDCLIGPFLGTKIRRNDSRTRNQCQSRKAFAIGHLAPVAKQIMVLKLFATTEQGRLRVEVSVAFYPVRGPCSVRDVVRK